MDTESRIAVNSSTIALLIDVCPFTGGGKAAETTKTETAPPLGFVGMFKSD